MTAASVAILIVGLALAALIPVRTGHLVARARVPLAFSDAVAEIGKRSAWERGRVVPKGQSILLVHERRTPTAVLLLHGFTNSPQQFDSLGRMLYRAGANVYIPRLPHHALVNGGIGALAQLTAEELRAASDSAMDLTAALGDTVVVAGLSLGGVMAAWIAQFRPEARRAIVIAPLFALYRLPRLADDPFVNLAVRLHGFTRYQSADSLDPDRAQGWNTRAIGEMLRFGLAVRRAARNSPPKCKSIDIVLNAHDRTIAAEPVIALERSWRLQGADVHMFELSASLGLPHDVIDPRQPVRRPDVVYPALIAMVNGQRPSLNYLDEQRHSACSAKCALPSPNWTETMALSLTSSAFDANAAIPAAHTCDGSETPPPLTWTGAPKGTKTFALIVDDPDAPDPKAPKRTFVHWVAYDIPASATRMDDSHREGVNDAKRSGYSGPCPPIGRHRYFFKLYALDTELGDLGAPTKADLERAMDGHILEQAQLIGTYEH